MPAVMLTTIALAPSAPMNCPLMLPPLVKQSVSGEKKYYLSNLTAKTDLRTLAATIKARWICEQAHQQLKEELGLDHFEGQSWQGLHRHALMTMIAYAFLPASPLSSNSAEKKNQWPPISANFARPGHEPYNWPPVPVCGLA